MFTIKFFWDGEMELYQRKQRKTYPVLGSRFLTVVIVSEPSNFVRRQTVRATWLKLGKNKVDYKHYFVVGGAGLAKETSDLLGREQSTYNDMIILPVLVDTYRTLTNKVLETFVWLHKNGAFFKYVLKCDEDTFVRVDDVIAVLKESGKERLYWGFFNGRARVKKSGKWKENKWILCDYYLPYALGGGYVLSASLLHYIAENAKNLSVFSSEDVSVGVWLASVAGVQRVHDPRFDTEFTSRGCSNSYLVTHKRSEDDLQQLAATLQSTGKLCRSEYHTRSSYMYNWDVPPSQCCLRGNSSVP
ncbi:hypothetical protein PR048_025615 [Dryococelus australis]|uniref:Hexosyltransferase n=1 Tax=Dryococelus australis TaxID=614101 RepID=A0ABQ9GRX5_9NEOP|nr:hypothetical protein PR048_025615 [Dryococelus australis]